MPNDALYLRYRPFECGRFPSIPTALFLKIVLDSVFFMSLLSLDERLFDFNQTLFAPKPAAITRQRSIGPNNPVARDHNGNLVCPVGTCHGAHGGRTIYALCDLGITASLASRNCAKFPPDLDTSKNLGV